MTTRIGVELRQRLRGSRNQRRKTFQLQDVEGKMEFVSVKIEASEMEPSAMGRNSGELQSSNRD